MTGLRTMTATGAGPIALLLATAVGGQQPLPAEDVQVPPGFRVDVLADGLPGVRTLKVGPDRKLYAVLSRAGSIVRLTLGGASAEPAEVVRGLRRPYGLAFHEGWMYVGETHRVVRYRGPGYRVSEVVVPDLPTGGHWTRELAFGPDGLLYVAVGSSCNVCEESDPRRAAVVRYRADGSGEEIVAEGLRNAAGLAFHPATGALWASQNERDMLGDDLPFEEINVLSDGRHFGWPYCHGRRVPNPEYRDRNRCASTVPPALTMQAHSAPLGMVFYEAAQFPEAYQGDLFVAFHGSWNRSRPTGYKLVRVVVENGRPRDYEDFATGWLQGERVRGRPVYPAVGPDGGLYLSDDHGGRIYRIRWVH